MRLFLAINIPERTRQLLNRKVEIIKNEINQDLKWIKQTNWHLTLKFIGDVSENKVDSIKNTLINTAKMWSQFRIQFRGLGAFPDLNYPRVLFVNITSGSKKITKIHNKLETDLTNKGFAPENNEYTPHLTIARSRKETSLNQVAKNIEKFKKKKYFINVYMRTDKISLMKSELLPEGPEYKEITGINLK